MSSNTPLRIPRISPMLYKEDMVRQILAKRKTKTRRIVKPQPDQAECDTLFPSLIKNDGVFKPEHVGKFVFPTATGEYFDFSPWGTVGDYIWVRENWRKYCYVDENGTTHFDREIIEYAADRPEPIMMVDGDGFSVLNKDGSEKYIPWRPNIFMPKSACRIFLKITSIALEQINDITREEAAKEGACFPDGELKPHWVRETRFPEENFLHLWETINGKESLKRNDWVWVIGFEVTDEVQYSDGDFVILQAS